LIYFWYWFPIVNVMHKLGGQLSVFSVNEFMLLVCRSRNKCPLLMRYTSSIIYQHFTR
jgi:hypothetical protein